MFFTFRGNLINSTKISAQPKADLIMLNGCCIKGHSGRLITPFELTWVCFMKQILLSEALCWSRITGFTKGFHPPAITLGLGYCL